MAKVGLTVKLSQADKDSLKMIADDNRRSITGQIEYWIRRDSPKPEKARKEKKK